MNTDEDNKPEHTELDEETENEPRIRFLDSPMPSPYRKVTSPDTNSSEARLNASSISDNNGGRIELNQENIIKK